MSNKQINKSSNAINIVASDISLEEQVRKVLKRKIKKQIKADLTIGRSDNDLQPYTKEQVKLFRTTNKKKIKKVINKIIKEANEKNGLKLYLNPMDDWIREYVYEEITDLDQCNDNAEYDCDHDDMSDEFRNLNISEEKKDSFADVKSFQFLNNYPIFDAAPGFFSKEDVKKFKQDQIIKANKYYKANNFHCHWCNSIEVIAFEFQQDQNNGKRRYICQKCMDISTNLNTRLSPAKLKCNVRDDGVMCTNTAMGDSKFCEMHRCSSITTQGTRCSYLCNKNSNLCTRHNRKISRSTPSNNEIIRKCCVLDDGEKCSNDATVCSKFCDEHRCKVITSKGTRCIALINRNSTLCTRHNKKV